MAAEIVLRGAGAVPQHSDQASPTTGRLGMVKKSLLDADLRGWSKEIGLPYSVIFGIGYLLYSAGEWFGPSVLLPVVTNYCESLSETRDDLKDMRSTLGRIEMLLSKQVSQ
jgi:hypothetical protein